MLNKAGRKVKTQLTQRKKKKEKEKKYIMKKVYILWNNFLKLDLKESPLVGHVAMQQEVFLAPGMG